MKKPYRFYLENIETKEIKPFIHYRSCPILEDVTAFVKTSENTFEKKVIFNVIEDTRFQAKLRLWKYINKIEGYNPFKGTEIGKTIPILGNY